MKECRRWVFSVSLGFILSQSNSVLAQAVDYQFTYDPVAGLTTIQNDASSSADIQFDPLVGPDAFQYLYLLAGDTVSVDQSGNVTGSFVDPTIQICKNKSSNTNGVPVYSGSSSVTITRGNNSVTFAPSPDPVYAYPGDTVTGDTATVKMDATITFLAPTSIVIDSPLWLEQGQANVELLYGSVDSVDDNSSFTTIFSDPNVATGCIPDGTATWFLCTIAFGGMAGLKRCVGR